MCRTYRTSWIIKLTLGSDLQHNASVEYADFWSGAKRLAIKLRIPALPYAN